MGLFRRHPTDRIEDFQPRLYAVVIALALIGAWVIAFIVKNDERISIDFVFFSASISLIFLIILLLGIGFLAGVLGSQLYRRRRRLLRGSPQEEAGADG